MANIYSFQDSSVMRLSQAKVKSILIEIQKKLGVQPKNFCFISGAPRSGTTAINSWLHEHPKITTFGESRMLIAVHRLMEEVYRFKKLDKGKKEIVEMARHLTYEYYRENRVLLGRDLIIEKEPLEPIALPDKRYKKFLENVKTLRPKGKFLFMMRDPIATIFSMSKRKWGLSLRDFEPQSLSLEEHIENWCSCVDCILEYADEPNTYICQFGRLLKDSDNESKKILDFLEIGTGKPFQPNKTKNIGFSTEECELILERSRPQLEALNERGINDLG